MKLKNFLLSTILILPILAAVSCSSSPEEQQVIVMIDDLKPGVVITPGAGQQAAVFAISDVPEKNIRNMLEKMYPNVEHLVLTTKPFVKEPIAPTPAVLDDPSTPEDEAKPEVPGYTPKPIELNPVTGPNGETDWGAWISNGLTLAAPLIPGAAAGWVPMALYIAGLLLKKRPRKHLGEALTSLNPLSEGSVNLSDAIGSIQKAIGYDHTNATPEELRAVADRLEAERALDAQLESARQ